MKKYSTLKNNLTLDCWHCNHVIEVKKIVASGYADGCYRVQCPNCEMHCFYNATAEQVTVGDSAIRNHSGNEDHARQNCSFR